MRLRSEFRAAVTIMNRLHRESGEERAETYSFSPISKVAPFFLKWFMVELGTRPKAGGAHEFIFFWFVCCSRFRVQLIAIYCSRWEVCGQYTSHVTFSHAVNTHSLLHITLHGSRMCWCASRHLHGHPRCATWLFVLSLFLTLFPSVCFSFFSTWTLTCTLTSSKWDLLGAISHWHSANWGVWPFGQQDPSHRLWAQHPWRFPLLRDYWNLLPGAIQRHNALVFAGRENGTRRIGKWRYNCCLESKCAPFLTTCTRGASRSAMHLPKTAKPECGTRRWGAGASAPAPKRQAHRSLKTAKAEVGRGQAPTLPVCPSANHTFTGHFPTHNVRRLWARTWWRHLEHCLRSVRKGSWNSQGSQRLKEMVVRCPCTLVVSGWGRQPVARRWPFWALWEDAMSMIAQGNVAVGDAAAESFVPPPEKCSVKRQRATDRMDRDGFWCRLCTLRRASRLATLVRRPCGL